MRRIRAHSYLLAFLIAFVFGGGTAYARSDLDLVISVLGGSYFSNTIADSWRAAITVPAGMVCGAVIAFVTGTDRITLTPTHLLIVIGVSVICAFGTTLFNRLNAASNPMTPKSDA